MIPGGDQSTSVKDAIAVRGLFDVDGAIVVQAVGEGSREYFGHVLDDNDSRAPGRHRLQEFTQSVRTPGGRADSNNSVSCGPAPWRWAQGQNDVGRISWRDRRLGCRHQFGLSRT